MATSPAKTRANQRNAQRSTGPRTSKGKAVSRLNALKHGALADILMDGGDRAAFETIHEAIAGELQPATAVESVLVQKIAYTIFRSRRLAQSEQRLFQAIERVDKSWESDIDYMRELSDKLLHGQALVGRYETSLNNQMWKLVRELKELQAERITIEGEAGRVGSDASGANDALALEGPADPSNDNGEAA